MSGQTKECIPEISVSTDMMSAKLKLHLDDNGQKLTVEDLKELLAVKNVKTGFLDDALQDMIEHDIYETFVEVAKGKAPVKGKDGYFKFHVTVPEEQKGAKVLEDGTVEYVHTTEYTIVEEGELLAEYIPATNGEYGFTVDNGMRTPMKGQEKSPLRGSGFRIENNKYYATFKGRVELSEDSIQVTKVLLVKGDVDIGYGHIKFDGDVDIRGDVHSGMMVWASGDIEIKGHVGSCYVEAGHDIILHNGMQGKFTGKLKAGGNIIGKFFENAQAVAGGDIKARTVMNSKMEAEGRVLVEGRGALVLGGSIHALQGMEIGEAGNESEIPTVLAAGVLQKTIRRDIELRELIKKVEGEVELLDRSAKILERMTKTNVTKETNSRRMKIIQAKVIKSTELKNYQEEKIRNDALITSGKDANIAIQNMIYPGCRIQIAGNEVQVKERVKHVKFIMQDGLIVASLLY